MAFSPNSFGEATQAIQGSESYVLGGANKATYHPSGAISTFTYGNGIKHKTTLNSRKFPACIRDYSSTLPDCGTTQSILNLNYGYDNNANITSIAGARDSGIYSLTNLTYDGLDRLKTTTGGGAIGSSNITYDPLRNIRTYSKNTGFNTHDFTYHYNITSHTLTKVTDTGNASIKIRDFTAAGSYDSSGNVLKNGSRNFTFNINNQMTASGNSRFYYDGFGRRIKTQKDNGDIEYSVYSSAGKLLHRTNNTGGINYIFLGDKLVAKAGGTFHSFTLFYGEIE